MRYYLIILLLAGSTKLLFSQQSLDSIRQVYQERIQKTMKKQHIVGVSICVVSKDSILWQDNYGFSDVATELPVTSNTLFGLGSVTKVFTATSVMQLVDEGKISLDFPLKTYLHEFEISGPDTDLVTPRNVLSHHSGLPSDIFKGMFTNKPEKYKVVADYLKDEYMAETPNKIRAYSNPGYTLLGHMVSEVTAMEYDQYVNDHILEPLEMENSGFNLIQEASKTYDSKGAYAPDAKIRDIPAGGMFSTASDMGAFMQAYLNKSSHLLQTSSFRVVATSQHDNAPLDFGNQYGLGWNINELPYAGQLLSHTGTTLYFNAALNLAPEADLGVVILTNSEKGGWLFREAKGIIEAISQELGMEKHRLPTYEDVGSSETINLSKEEISQFEGFYTAPGATIKTFVKGKRLNMKLQGLRVVMLPVDENKFLPKIMLFGFIPIKMRKARFIFENVGGEDVLTLIEKGSPKELTAKKLPSQSISNAWTSRLGPYEMVNPLDGELEFFHDFKLMEAEGILIFSFTQVNNGQKQSMALEIINDKRAKIAGLGRYAGQNLQLADDSTIKIFGLELKKTEND